MKTLKDHPFFAAIEQASALEQRAKQWGAGNANRRPFYRSIQKAHPFIFDKKTSVEKRLEGRAFSCFDELVQDFSLPFSTSLYLLTDPLIINTPMGDANAERFDYEVLGYLIDEQGPEQFVAFEVGWIHVDGKKVSSINQFNIDLKLIATALKHAEALGFEIFNKSTKAHVLKETSSILALTDCISVKRIGVEKARKFSVKTRDMGVGITSIKHDNIIHIADKIEYEYTTPLENSKINWDYVGFWRGHWRAFYVKDSMGETVKDSMGWNTVDYSRFGKNRAGEEKTVPGYTWVIEHTRGNPELAEMKTRIVKAK